MTSAPEEQDPPRLVLLDIEGTTTDIAFVHQVLFPLSRDAMPAYVAKHWDSEEIAAARAATGANEPAALGAALIAWIDADEKETALKAIQGKIWRAAYEAGQVKSHVYPDVPSAFRRWKSAGIGMAIFSSGSVEAQGLLFRHTSYGDLTPYFRAYFDTTTGPKREASAYAAIARALEADPREIVFLSDVTAELDAARAAGLDTRQLVRPGVADDRASSHAKVKTFDALDF